MIIIMPATNMIIDQPALDRPSQAQALYRLMAWLSPSYPVGAYTYSHGLEWAVEAGQVNSAATARAWLGDLIVHGGGFADAVILCATFDAFASGDDDAIISVAELSAALPATAELALETTAQGAAFLKITRDAWGCAASDKLLALWKGPIALPVALGAAAFGHRLARDVVAAALVQAFAANLVSAAVRLVPLGQTDGQKITASLEPVVLETASRACDTPLSALTSCCLMADIGSMRHETQYTRLFRS